MYTLLVIDDKVYRTSGDKRANFNLISRANVVMVGGFVYKHRWADQLAPYQDRALKSLLDSIAIDIEFDKLLVTLDKPKPTEYVTCAFCGEVCKVLDDPDEGLVSDCHGTGIELERDGKVIIINENLRYVG